MKQTPQRPSPNRGLKSNGYNLEPKIVKSMNFTPRKGKLKLEKQTNFFSPSHHINQTISMTALGVPYLGEIDVEEEWLLGVQDLDAVLLLGIGGDAQIVNAVRDLH